LPNNSSHPTPCASDVSESATRRYVTRPVALQR
jgi:hypothetical protein